MKLDNLFELSFCINLKERRDRWKKCQKEFEKINFFPERFEAIKDENPVVGCRKSHLEILKIAEQEKKNVLIFEDDVSFINYKGNIIENALDELYQMDWWMFYLGANLMRPCYQVSDHLAKLSHAQSTHAYSINKKYLPQIIECIENNHTFIDVIYAEAIVPNTNCYITIPMVAIQRTDYSDIEKMEMSYDTPIKRYDHYLIRRKKNNI